MLLSLFAGYLFVLQGGEEETNVEYTTESIAILIAIIAIDLIFTILAIVTYYKQSKFSKTRSNAKDGFAYLLSLFAPIIVGFILISKK
jgi:hypothetical protein